jgi:hypothetical protein
MNFSEQYRNPLGWAVGSAVVFGVVSFGALDMGQTRAMYGYSLLVVLACILAIMIRRPSEPTKTDLLVIKWAGPVVFVLNAVIYPLVWRAKGLQ